MHSARLCSTRTIRPKCWAGPESRCSPPRTPTGRGYVPNVVYTCGALKVGKRLLVPYGISDSAVGFATVKIDELLKLMD